MGRLISNSTILINGVRAALSTPLSKATVWRATDCTSNIKHSRLHPARRLTVSQSRVALVCQEKYGDRLVKYPSFQNPDNRIWFLLFSRLDNSLGWEIIQLRWPGWIGLLLERYEEGAEVIQPEEPWRWYCHGLDGFRQDGVLDFSFISTHMNSATYYDMLSSQLLPFWLTLARNFVFQQDCAAIHASRSSIEWFAVHNVTVMD